MADASYLVPAATHQDEHVVTRSRFVTTLARAETAADAHALVARLREEHPGATHHCWAFVAGPPGSTAHIGMGDGGEPHGTAGRPMLTVLLHSGVGEIAAVSSRWFGGTKLGTGGLARAYAEGVTRALANLPTELRVRRESVAVTVAYPHVESLRRLAAELGAVIEGETYGAEVRYRIAVPVDAMTLFETRLADATAGEGRVTKC